MNDEQMTRADADRISQLWLDRIKAAETRESKWREDAEWAENAYLCGTTDDNEGGLGQQVPDFNIVHSNVETIVPAVYNSTPAPDIRPMHGNRDEAARQFADALERAISAQIDDDSITPEIEGLAQDAVLTGRGVTRVRFKAQVTLDPMTGEETVTGERVVFENVSWRDYREGPAKRWADVPWVAYRHFISQEEMDRISDESISSLYDAEEADEELDVPVWEVWCKETGKVYMIAETGKKVISVQDDPLGLKDFFPQPSPVQPIKGTGMRIPVCPHKTYRTLSNELDLTTRRINAIVKGLKVRGVIAGDAEVVDLISRLDDNELAPAPDMQSLMAQGGLDNAVLWWPVDMAISVLQQLYVQREQTKATIYEVTGISDIVRGVSDPRETAEAQRTKSQWGSQRIKRLQRMIQSHVRDLFVLASEIMAQNFSVQTFAKVAGVQPTPELQQMMGRFDEYRIDIETDSTIRADLTFQRQEMAEFLRASGEYMAVMAPLIEKAPAASGAVMEMYASFANSFQLGKRAEDALQQMVDMAAQAGQQQQSNPEAEAERAKMAMEGQKLQVEAQRAQADMAKAQSDAQISQAKMMLERQKAQAEMLLKRMEIALKSQDLGLAVDKQQLEREKAQFDAMMRVQEMGMEREQQRPVAV